VTKGDEVEGFSSVLQRLSSLVKLKIEFPRFEKFFWLTLRIQRTQGIEFEEVKILTKSCQKCYTLKSVEVHLIG